MVWPSACWGSGMGRGCQPWGLGAPRGGARKLLSLSAVGAVCARSSFGCSRTLVVFSLLSCPVRSGPVRSPAAQVGALLLLGGMCCVCVLSCLAGAAFSLHMAAQQCACYTVTSECSLLLAFLLPRTGFPLPRVAGWGVPDSGGSEGSHSMARHTQRTCLCR